MTMRMTLSVLLALTSLPCVCAAQQSVSTTVPSGQTNSPQDLSNWLGFAFAPTAGGGVDTGSPRELSSFGGIKIGAGLLPLRRHDGRRLRYRTVTLDFGYDRVRSYNGFSAELSVMLPVVWFPKPKDERSNYLRIYGEPGIGYRMGGGPFGGYASAKVMLAVLSHERLETAMKRPSPFVEIQRRFSIPSMSRGDFRVVAGLLFAVCNECGVE